MQTLFRGVRSMYQKIFLMSSHSCSVVKILLRTGVYLVFCGCSGCSARTDTELTTISCFSDADSFTGFVKEQRWSLYNPTRFWARFSCKNCISAAAIMFPLGTLERQEHALRQTQTSRTKWLTRVATSYVLALGATRISLISPSTELSFYLVNSPSDEDETPEQKLVRK